jgi:hypothetical protein
VTEPAVARAGRRRGATVEPAVGWLVRLLWIALPFTAGPVLAQGLGEASRPVQIVASAYLWAGWAAAVVATFVALPVSVTAVRTLAPAGLAAVVAAAVAEGAAPLAVGWMGVCTAWVFSPAWSARCVNGPAYPNERRFLLRAPAPLLFGGLFLVWALAAGCAVAGPLLLAARQWVAGSVVSVVGLPLAGLLARGLHELSRRWIVFVPAGLVLHDPVMLVDPVLLRRQSITRVGATSGGLRHTGALDLTQRAPGLAVEVALEDDVNVTLLRPGRRLGVPAKARQVRFTPTRPGALLDEARRRRLPVG